METPALVFIGFMGAGKTTGARAAAAALGVRAVDTDRELEQRLGTSIEDYFASHGERAFREAEEDVVAEVLETVPAPVISLGGGSIGSARVRELLARHTVVMLDVDEATAWRRAGGKRRPLARDRERFAALHAERAPQYEALADAVLLDGGAETIRRAAGALRRIPTGVKALWAVAGEHNYPVYVGDVLDGTFWPLRGRRFLLSDESVAPLYADRVPDALGPFVMPAGEEAKTLANAEVLLRGLAEAGMDHDDHVAALGGGVVGDVAGFCAGVYQRGVGVVQVPTTLVAQVDSAYGGKTGVDLPEGKNYVGVYHQPRAVLSDPRVLSTLPPRGARGGLGRGDQDGADRRRSAVGARAARRAGRGPRPRAGVCADQARRGRPRRARRRPAPGAQPRPHRRARDRDRDRLRALPARRGGRARPARGADAVRAGSSCGARWRSCSRSTGCPRSSTPTSTRTRSSPPCSATRSAAADGWASSSSTRPATSGRACRWLRTTSAPRFGELR